jgi:hypothetical protein
MHPQIIQDHPGNCPICGMKLTPIRKQAGTGAPGERKIAYYKSTMNPGETSPQPGKDSMGMDMVPVYENAANESQTIAIDPATIQTMNIRIAEVTRGPLRRVIRTVANVDYDETALADVTTKYKGWIEKLYVDATGALVNPGDPLFEIYSPELYSAQTEYLAALSAVSGTPSAEDRALLDSRTGKKTHGNQNADRQRAHRRVCGRKKHRSRPDGGCRHEALPAGGHRRGVGLCAGVRAGFVRRPARPGGDDDAVVSARPQIPRAGHLRLSDGG